jgi:hypothetical protein
MLLSKLIYCAERTDAAMPLCHFFVSVQHRAGDPMSRDAIVSRFVIPDRLLSPSMATNTLATGTPTLRKDSAE